MRIAIAQLDPVIGAFDENVKKIQEAYAKACAAKAALLLTPEMGICGYPPHDLVERPEIFERCEKALETLRQLTQGQDTALVVGYVGRNPAPGGRHAQNVVSILSGGKVAFTQAKTLLPTYDVFDEARYFEPAQSVSLWDFNGTPTAVAICEDLWAGDPALKRSIYRNDPLEQYRTQGPRLLISISASPYEWGKRARREELHSKIAQDLKVPLVYVNQVGANDEILFDGGSFALDAKGKLLGRMPFFKTGFSVVEVDTQADGPVFKGDIEMQAPSEIEILHRGLVVGIRNYFERTGFKTAILGLSGGIDSAVVAALAVEALGPKNILGVAMPSQFSSSGSLADAEALAKNLGMALEVKPIKFLYSTLSRELSERRGELAPIALENLQSRLRGLTLMTLANHYQALVLTTGNKSELATGYCTLYGDMCGALCPIGDIFKTRVYELARHMNGLAQKSGGFPIPESSLTKAPSAELRPNQTDQDTLPPYELLDALLEDYLERGMDLAEIHRKFDAAPGAPGPNWVSDTLKKVEINEYKRRQSAPVLKASTKAFGIGRRVPIANAWQV